MNAKFMKKKLWSSNSEMEASLSRIKDSVQKAEENTSGEIVLAITPESSDYSFWELFASVIATLIFFLISLPFASFIKNGYESLRWQSPDWYLPAAYGFTLFVFVLIFFFVFNIPLFDRIIIPFDYKKKKVTERAFRFFSESGVYCTKEHTGVLIFVSFLEKQVRIVADKGISTKISSDLWQIIADSLAEEIKNKNIEEGFIDAVQKCGDLLCEYFPAGKENPDELSDGLVILED